MSKLVKIEKVSLKNHPNVKEDAIQEFILMTPQRLVW